MLDSLHFAIAMVAPISGVKQYSDGTYGIDFLDSVSLEQRQAAQAVVDSWAEPDEPKLVYS